MALSENVLLLMLSSVSTVGVLAGIGYFFRNAILTIVNAKLDLASKKELQLRQHRFEKTLHDFEKLQSAQQRFLASLLEVSSERTKAISMREIDAAEAIWASVDKMDSLLVTTHTADLLEFDAIERLGPSDREKVKVLAKMFTKNLTPKFSASVNCQWARLYVNEAAWAFYHAYLMIVFSGAFRMMALETGIPVSDTFDKTGLQNAIVEALPHQKSTFDKVPDIGGSFFLEELRQALLGELKRSIQGEQSTKTEIAKARAILNALPTDIPKPSKS